MVTRLYISFFAICSQKLSQHLLCDIHMRDNVEDKLRKLGERPEVIIDVVEDIFGKRDGDEKIAGLVDCSEEAFEKEKECLYNKWVSGMADGALFVAYFKDKKEQLVRNTMLLSKRIACRLNLDVYTQNANECMNSVIRKETGMAKMKLKPFVEMMQQLVTRQEKDIEEALIDKTGGIELVEQYSNLAISRTDFFRM